MKMSDWASFLNRFLELSDYPILANTGKVTALEAKLTAEGEYEIYREKQDAEYLSDFDRVVEETSDLTARGAADRSTSPETPSANSTWSR